MPITPKPGHWYETRRGDVVAYTRPSFYVTAISYPHIVGGLSYTADGHLISAEDPAHEDLVKDLGTTDPRQVQKPRKKATRKTRKVRMWFMQVGTEGKICNNLSRDGLCTMRRILMDADTDGHYVFGPIFSQVIDVPVTKKAPHA